MDLTIPDLTGAQGLLYLEISASPAHTIMLCYSVVDRASFNALKTTLMPKIKESIHKNAPLLLVGTKLDLVPQNLDEYVSPEEAERFAKEINAVGSIQCSSFAQAKNKTGNVDTEFKLAMKAALEHEHPELFRSSCCCGFSI